MILSKAALQLVTLTTPDKDVPILDCVCIEPNGIVVACNRNVSAAVLPLGEQALAAIPLESSGRLDAPVVLTSDTVSKILKMMPKDNLFKGLLEYCDIKKKKDANERGFVTGADTNSYMVTTTDGKQTHSMQVQSVRLRFLDYKEEFRKALQPKSVVDDTAVYTAGNPFFGRVITNRKRFKAFVECLEKVCSYDGNFSPVYMDFLSSSDYVVARSANELTGQQLTAIMSKGQGEWIVVDPKEKMLFLTGAKKLQKVLYNHG